MNIFSRHRRWFVLLGLMLIYAATNGIIVHTMPLLYPALIDEFSWTTQQITLPATVFYIFGAISSPPAGVLLDRFSPRKVMIWGMAGILVCLLCLALISDLWHMVAIFFGLGLSLSLCGLTASMVVLTKWFSDLRGRAIGLLLMASSLGGALFPLVLGSGMEAYGWRSAITMVSVVAVIMAIPSLLFFVLDKPAVDDSEPELKLEKGDDVNLGQVTAIANAPLGTTLSEAVRKPTFYLIAFATACVWFSIIALVQHQSIHLVRDVGIDRSLLPKVFSLFFACSVVGKLGFGWLGDYLNKELTLIASIATFTIGLLIIKQISGSDNLLLFVYAVVAGVGFSGAFTTIQLLIAEHYAGASYGKILAILVMVDSLAGGLGTRVIATMRDSSDNYLGALNFMIFLCVIAMLCIYVVKLLNRPNVGLTTQLGVAN